MKYLVTLCILLSAITADAQNLISNPNFASYSGCPPGPGCISYCTGWNRPTLGSSDYYNVCNPSVLVSVPQNKFGYQPSTSNAYTGFYTYFANTTLSDYKEYISTTFSPLQIGATYRVSITVSLSDSSFYACDGLGVLFTTYFLVSNYSTYYYTLPIAPQIDYSSYGILTDKVNWVTLTKDFIADSTYTNLAIGNFKTSITTSKAPMPYYSVSSLDSTAYYYIDSVSVEKIAPPALTHNTAYGVSTILSPNPFTDYTTLTFNNDTRIPHTLDIYNIQGRLVRTLNDITTGNIRIERDNLETGFYYYKLYGADDMVANGRFVVKD